MLYDLINGKWLGLYFYDERQYKHFLLNELSIMFNDILQDIRASLIFKQNGILVHNANIVRNSFNEYFPSRWVGIFKAV